MYASDLTLGTRVYALRAQRTNSSVRAVPGEPVNEPNLLTISHDVANSGRISSAIMLDDTKVITLGTSSVADTVRCMLKIQYNPLSGRAGIEADINKMLTEIVDFLATPANITKLLNRES